MVTAEVKDMKLASIREFRSGLSGYSQDGEMVIVTNHGRMVGCFLPLEQGIEVPIELKKEFVAALGRKIFSSLSSRKVSEREVLDGFEKFKKSRRG